MYLASFFSGAASLSVAGVDCLILASRLPDPVMDEIPVTVPSTDRMRASMRMRPSIGAELLIHFKNSGKTKSMVRKMVM